MIMKEDGKVNQSIETKSDIRRFLKKKDKDGKVSRFFNQSLFQFTLKTPNIAISIKIQTVFYVVIEIALIIAILKYL